MTVTGRDSWKRADEISVNFCAAIQRKDPEMFARTETLLKELDLGGLWRGRFIALDRIICALLEQQKKDGAI